MLRAAMLAVIYPEDAAGGRQAGRKEGGHHPAPAEHSMSVTFD
jgi:hypothetical protein